MCPCIVHRKCTNLRHDSILNMASSATSRQLPPLPVHYFKRDGTPVSCLSFLTCQDKPFLAQGSQDGNLTVWDLQTCEPRWSVAAHSVACRAILQLEDGRVLTQGRNESVRLWDMDAQQSVTSLPFTHHGFCRAAVVGGRLACPCQPFSDVALLDLRSGREEGRLSAPAELGAVMALQPLSGEADGRLAAVYESGVLLLWQPDRTRQPAARIQLTDHTPMCLDVAADGRGLVGTSGNTAPTFTVTADGLEADAGVQLTNAGVASARLRPDGKLAALGCWDHRLRLVSWRQLRLLAVLDHHTATVECVEFAPAPVKLWKANALLASGSSDGTVALWKVYDDA